MKYTSITHTASNMNYQLNHGNIDNAKKEIENLGDVFWSKIICVYNGKVEVEYFKNVGWSD